MSSNEQLFSGDATKAKAEIANAIVASFQIAMDAGMADEVDHIAEADTASPALIVVMRGGARYQITITPATAREKA